MYFWKIDIKTIIRNIGNQLCIIIKLNVSAGTTFLNKTIVLLWLLVKYMYTKLLFLDEEEAPDIHTCGGCGEFYNTLDLFVKHKIVCKSKKKTTKHRKVKH
jgi:hypothetical protein